MGRLKTRRAKAGDARVIVVEKEGILTAIVIDRSRGAVEIPLGPVDASAALVR
jgi:hypothetical protein